MPLEKAIVGVKQLYDLSLIAYPKNYAHQSRILLCIQVDTGVRYEGPTHAHLANVVAVNIAAGHSKILNNNNTETLDPSHTLQQHAAAA